MCKKEKIARNEKITYSYQRAQQIVSASLKLLSDEIVEVGRARQRITACDVVAVKPQPSFDESTRDGYIIPASVRPDEGICRFRVVDEIPAGKVFLDILIPGTACRIMTGGCVPPGGTRVVPYENCVEKNGEITVANHLLQSPETFIAKTGSYISSSDVLVPGGVHLRAEHLSLMASCGVEGVKVSARPAVGFFCTGSELTTPSSEIENGQKFSSNSLLIEGLLASLGAIPTNLGIVQDKSQELLALLAKVRTKGLDMAISTGGMGPGKYDLVERTFVEAGGEVIFNAIAMRPGKSVLFGTLGRTLFFGLPGPPFAVRTLLNELVGPPLLAMQGMRGDWPKKVQAHLLHRIEIKRHDVLRLRDGVASSEAGNCTVRFTTELEIPNCYIVLPVGQQHYLEGELVDVHLTLGSFCQNPHF